MQDLRFGVRLLRRNRGFAAVAILTLALGVGANTAIFSVVEAVLLRPLPFKHASQLVLVGEGFPQLGFGGSTFAAPDYAFYANHQRCLESVGAFQNADYELSGGGKPERVTGDRVSASLFPLLGVSASPGARTQTILLLKTYSRNEGFTRKGEWQWQQQSLHRVFMRLTQSYGYPHAGGFQVERFKDSLPIL